MKKIVFAFALLLLSVPSAYATEIESANEVEPVPAVQPSLVGEAPAAPEMHLETIQVQEIQQTEMAEDSGQWPQRGSFWWIVGAIVVGGVILALLLD